MPADDVSGGVVDPFDDFTFRVWWDGREVAGFTKVRGLATGQTDDQPVVLERGVTDDVAFEQWANKMWYHPTTGQPDDAVSLGDLKKDVRIEVHHQSGALALRVTIARCWPSSYTGLPELDASGMVAIAHLTLQHEGWTRGRRRRPSPAPAVARGGRRPVAPDR